MVISYRPTGCWRGNGSIGGGCGSSVETFIKVLHFLKDILVFPFIKSSGEISCVNSSIFYFKSLLEPGELEGEIYGAPKDS